MPSRLGWALIALAFAASAVRAGEFKITEVRALAAAGVAKPFVITFTDHHDDEAADPATGLISFEDWQRTRPLQQRFLSPYPGYTEPTVSITVNGVTKPVKEKLHIYEAEARFVLPKAASSIDLAHYATVAFLERIDPAISHKSLSPAEAKQSANRNPDRAWCDPKASAACIQSRYQFEGKLPSGIHLVNQLTESKKKIADYLEFESELRILAPSELDQPALAKLTGVDAPATGALEQNIFYVNEILQFGKVLVVFQPNPADAGQTIVTGFIALAIKTHVLENKKKYESVPVLRNLVPAQVLAGKSSFNTGSSISAGLPGYARNEIKAVAGILAQD